MSIKRNFNSGRYKIDEHSRDKDIKYFIDKKDIKEKNDIIENFKSKYDYILNNLQIVILIDTSSSMLKSDDDIEKKDTKRDNWKRYDNVIKIINCIINIIFESDKDKEIPVYFFNDNNFNHIFDHFIIRDPELFKQKCKDRKIEQNKKKRLGNALKIAFKENIKDDENTLFMVFTDGCIEDNENQEIFDLIKNKLTDKDPLGNKLNILFVRIGDDPKAKQFLRMLDINKEICKNVDTKSDNSLYIMKDETIIINSIFETLDKIYQKI